MQMREMFESLKQTVKRQGRLLLSLQSPETIDLQFSHEFLLSTSVLFCIQKLIPSVNASLPHCLPPD